MSQSQTVTKQEIEALPEVLKTDFPDAWSSNSTFQEAVPVLQREIARLHDSGADVSGMVRAVIQLGETEQKNRERNRQQ
jgi:hypothetical protein